jgi:hypothetical protein
LELGGNNAIIVTRLTILDDCGAVLELWELLDKDVLQPAV